MPVDPLLPPSIDRPDTFEAEAQDFVLSLVDFGVQINELEVNVEEKAATATAAAIEAGDMASAAIAAAQVTGVTTTSTTSILIGPGVINLVVEPGMPFVEGHTIKIASTVDPVNLWMVGDVVTYSPETGGLAVDIALSSGDGVTASSWNVFLYSPPRAAVGAVDVVAHGVIPGPGVLIALRADGKAEVVSGVEASAGSAGQMTNNCVIIIGCAHDIINDKIVVAYTQNSNNYGYAVVGTISGADISFDAPVAFNSAITNSNDYHASNCVCYDAATGKIIIVFQNYTVNALAIVGTVSGLTITFGAGVAFYTGNGSYVRGCVYDSTNQRVVILYRDPAANYWKAVAGQVSGTSITFGTAVAMESAASSTTDACLVSLGAGKFLAFYSLTGPVHKATTFTVAGSVVTVATVKKLLTAGMATPCAAYHADGDYILLAGYISGAYAVQVIRLLGTTIMDEQVVTPVVSNSPVMVVEGMLILNPSNGYLVLQEFAVDDFEVILGPAITFYTAKTSNTGRACLTAGGKVICAHHTNSDNYGHAEVLSPRSTNVGDWIGMAQGSAADGETFQVGMAGLVDEHQSGLTTGNDYYLEYDGTLTTTKTRYGKAGKALASTRIYITGLGGA